MFTRRLRNLVYTSSQMENLNAQMEQSAITNPVNEKDELSDMQWPGAGIQGTEPELSAKSPYPHNYFFKRVNPSTGTLSTMTESVSPFSRSITACPFLPHPMSILEKLRANQSDTQSVIDMEIIRRSSPELEKSYKEAFFLNHIDESGEKKDSSDIKRPLFHSSLHLTKQLVQLFVDLVDDHMQNSASEIDTNSIYFDPLKLNISQFKRSLSKLIKYLVTGLADHDNIETVLILMLIYLDTYLAQKKDYFHFQNLNQLIIPSAMLAHKFIDDVTVSNPNFAQYIGTDLKRINNLELNFIQDIGYTLDVLPKIFSEYRVGLFNYCKLNNNISSSQSTSPLPVASLSPRT